MVDGSIGRRDFLKGAAATVAFLLTAEDLLAAGTEEDKPVTGPAVKFGVIGLGTWGKEHVTTLSKLPSAQITAICDTYEAAINKCKEIAPNAATFTDYRKLLESPEVEAVVIATPSHQHKEIALAALQAGKHVYCESPLSNTMEEAKAIALAGLASKQVFQVGEQGRSNLLYNHVHKFVKMGVLRNPALVHAQWHKRESWRRMASNPEREKALNWRLDAKTSAGIAGEEGIHQFDLVNWYLNSLPKSVTGFGNVINWNDGRDVPDTVQCVIEYPNKATVSFASTLASSFSNAYTLFQGSDASLLMRERRGWMIKEADSPLWGWEVYARKEQCYEETGICMVADASKLLAAGKEPSKETNIEPSKEALFCALENFTRSIREGAKVSSGAVEGYQSTVTAVKANEAIVTGTKIAYQPEWFELK